MKLFDVMLALGVGWWFVGFVLRGFHQAAKREAALRAQDERLARASGLPAPVPASPADRKAQQLARAYRLCWLVGTITLVLAFVLR